MDLFAAVGIDIGDGGRGGRSGRAAVRTLKVPLLNYKVVAEALKTYTFDFTDQQRAAALSYAKNAKASKFTKEKETSVRPLFFDKILGEILGYRKYESEGGYTLAFEHPIRRGAVDVALGKFGIERGKDEIVAPFELKGPGTTDLDAIMPGRGRSPVQQAWDYAIDAPGSKWVLVSNCVEIRLYGFGKGRDAFEQFDLRKLDEERELERLFLLLSADRLLGGATEALLRETEGAYKDVTGKLYESYKALRDRLISYVTDEASGPKLPMLNAIELAQKILDRILFIAFAQRTDLLPDRLLKGAAEEISKYVPKPLWHNFQGLFRAIDGEPNSLNIWGYNGGLFALDPVADALVIPDPLATDLASLGEWDYRSEVPVTVLGHIFEQSITDIERLRAIARGEEPPKVSKSKRQGVVYTPEIVTRFLVEHTIDVCLEERFAALLVKHGKPVTPRSSPKPIFTPSEDTLQRAFWKDYLAALRAFTVVDPACGSGAFLVAAFDLLAREYRGVIELLATLDEEIDFDPFDEIVTKNLYGVDINAESVEITRLALWLKTARNQHRLQNLEATIKVGDSLIDDKEWTERPFSWQAAFPNVFAKGGFDVVIGNPPYVRSEHFSAIKPWLKKRYTVFDGGADLYCYFYERALQILKDNGRLGFISSCGFFKTTFGELLRQHLRRNVVFECGIDFGDARIFEGVTTYPAVLTVRKQKPAQPYEISFLNYSGNGVDDLTSAFKADSFLFPSERLDRARWHFEIQNLWQLRTSLERASKMQLGSISSPVSGIKTGLTKAFVISETTKSHLISQDPRSVELIRSWTVGDDLARWAPEQAKEYLLFLPKGWTKAQLHQTDELKAWSKFEGRYGAVASWLKTFETEARSRSDKGDFWWELRACDYYDLFDEALVTYPEMSQGPKFSLKRKGVVSNNKTFLIPKSNPATLAFLNSQVSWFLLSGICTALRGGQWRLELRADFLKELPLPDFHNPLSRKLRNSGNACEQLTLQLYEARDLFLHRILSDLAPSEHKKFSSKLKNFWTLDFPTFRAEVKKALKSEIPVKDRDGWEKYLADKSAEVIKLTAEIEAAEREIDAIVYKLFDLTPDEIKLLEASLEGQY
jgi:hypothetical protein